MTRWLSLAALAAATQLLGAQPMARATEEPTHVTRAERPVPSPSTPATPAQAPAPAPADAREGLTAWLGELHASNLCLVALANAGQARVQDDELQSLAARIRERRLALDQSLMAVLHELDIPQASLQPTANVGVSDCLRSPAQRQLMRRRGPRSTPKILAAVAAHETNDLDRLRAVKTSIEGSSSPLLKSLAQEAETAFRQTREEAERLSRARTHDGESRPPS